MDLQRLEGSEGERETNIDARKKHWPVTFHMPLGIKPKAQACTLNKNQTCNLPVYGTSLQPSESHWPGAKLSNI